MKSTKMLVGISAIAASWVFLFCNKKNMQQPPTKQLITTMANLKTTATGVLLTDATVLAQKFLQSKNPGKTVSIETAETVIKDGVPYMHIINANNDLGYAIFSADSIYAPLLAYDSIGNFDKTNLNPGLAMWFNKHAHELDFVRNTKTAYIDSIGKSNKILWMGLGSTNTASNNKRAINNDKVRTNRESSTLLYTTVSYATMDAIVGPLCPTQWDQTWPWNQYCPTGSLAGEYNLHTPAGCVPVAMAQVMYFWKWPNGYNWNIMPLTKNTGLTTDQQESARLVHDIGTTNVGTVLNTNAQFTSYDDGGSSSDDSYCPTVFNSFYYSSAQRTESIADQILSGSKDGTAYADFLYNEILTNNRPCLLSGFSSKRNYVLLYIPSTDGHTWVCDGVNHRALQQISTDVYSDHSYTYISYSGIYSYFHMNWGWGGRNENNNGWYDASINYSQSVPSETDFGYFQTVIYNIHP